MSARRFGLESALNMSWLRFSCQPGSAPFLRLTRSCPFPALQCSAPPTVLRCFEGGVGRGLPLSCAPPLSPVSPVPGGDPPPWEFSLADADSEAQKETRKTGLQRRSRTAVHLLHYMSLRAAARSQSSSYPKVRCGLATRFFFQPHSLRFTSGSGSRDRHCEVNLSLYHIFFILFHLACRRQLPTS